MIINQIKQQLAKLKIDGFIIPSNDEFMGEYVPESAKRLQFVTNFTGSNGVAIITAKNSAFFTDGRYSLQARMQIDQKIFEIYDLANKTPWQWLIENNIQKLGFDPWLHTEQIVKNFPGSKPVDNLVDLLWKSRPIDKKSKVINYPIKYAGKSVEQKIKQILLEQKADYLILTQTDSICWLLNIRADDVPFCPLLLCYAIVSKDGKINLFLKNKTDNFPRINNCIFHDLSDIEQFCTKIQNKIVQLDPNTAPFWFIGKFTNIIRQTDPCLLLKSIKNKAEIKGMTDSHISDGLAVIKFLYWIEQQNNISELDVVNKILEFRKQNKLFKYPSFSTIAGYGSNGAIIHYGVTEKTNKKIAKDNLLLVDSGGQYFGGTTDITRTVHLGKPTKEHIKYYTLVLKGHIALANAVFPVGTCGYQLDAIARYHLWQNGVDYNHGTGHGVGSFLNVHEGPQRISKYPSNVELREGMVISNEPGFYLNGKFGIRLENLVLVEKFNKEFLRFKTLTLVPFETKLIDKTILNREELNWLDQYYHEILFVMIKLINNRKLDSWLRAKCSF